MTSYSRGRHPNSLSNLGKHKYEVNSKYFEGSSFEVGYYAGLLASDGCVYGDPERAISWSVQRRDRQLLEGFVQAVNYTGVVRDYESNGHPQSNVTITDETMVHSLRQNYKITPRKSLTLEAPSISDLVTRDGYVKGFIDGDGSIGVYHDNQLKISVLGTKSVTEFIASEWERVTGLSVPCPIKRRGVNYWVVEVGKGKARSVFEHYYNLPLGLTRKWSDDKHDLCVNWRWKSKKYLKHIPQYEVIAANVEALTLNEIATKLGCTYENVWYIVNRSEAFKHYMTTR